MEKMDLLIALGLKRTKERRGSVASLFGERTNRKKITAVPYPTTYSFKEMLAWENEAFGFYFTGHPLDEFREKFSTLKKSKDLEQFAGKRVKVGGIIKQARQVTTKNGESMAFINLEDFDGEIDVAIFPKIFCDAIYVVYPNEIVVVEGRVEFSNDTVQILADKVTAAEFYVADFWLTVPKSLDLPETFNSLKKIFYAHEGTAQVFLNRGGTWQKLQQKISEDAFNELEKLLGAENIRRY